MRFGGAKRLVWGTEVGFKAVQLDQSSVLRHLGGRTPPVWINLRGGWHTWQLFHVCEWPGKQDRFGVTNNFHRVGEFTNRQRGLAVFPSHPREARTHLQLPPLSRASSQAAGPRCRSSSQKPALAQHPAHNGRGALRLSKHSSKRCQREGWVHSLVLKLNKILKFSDYTSTVMSVMTQILWSVKYEKVGKHFTNCCIFQRQS